MKKFRFRLEKILSLRARKEDQVRIELETVLGAVAAVEKNLADLKELRLDLERTLFEARSRPEMDVFRILLMDEGMERLSRQLKETQQQLVRVRKEAEQVRQKFMKAKRHRKRLDQIKAKHWQRYEEETRAEERKYLDETAVVRFRQQANAEPER